MILNAPVIAGNWKLNLGPSQARAFVQDLLPRLPPPSGGTIALFPPALSLAAVREGLGARGDVHLGVQNVYWESSGAFTGELSAPMAADAGAALVLVGHSERRHLFGETDAQVGRKLAAVLDVGLIPVLCVGETLEQRDAGIAAAVVEGQLVAALDGLALAPDRQVLVAYEPVWAIGTGRTATPDDAAQMHRHIRSLLPRFPLDAATTHVLYGGSVKPENAADLLRADAVAGLLIGGASLDAEGFSRICSLRA